MLSESERFWSRAQKGGDDDCWIWHGSINKNGPNHAGYGQCQFRGKVRGAHQVALILSGKPRPNENMCALHTCDNSLCVNPAHLRWGTHKDNMADCIARGRYRPKQRLLTYEQAVAIRSDPRGSTAIAKSYGCSTGAIWQIKQGITYRSPRP